MPLRDTGQLNFEKLPVQVSPERSSVCSKSLVLPFGADRAKSSRWVAGSRAVTYNLLTRISLIGPRESEFARICQSHVYWWSCNPAIGPLAAQRLRTRKTARRAPIRSRFCTFYTLYRISCLNHKHGNLNPQERGMNQRVRCAAACQHEDLHGFWGISFRARAPPGPGPGPPIGDQVGPI